MLQNLLPRSWGLLTHKCQHVPPAHPTQPAWQTCCFSRSPHHLWAIKSPQASWSDCKMILEIALFHRADTPGQPWDLPPCLLSSPAVPCCHLAHCSACGAVISPLSTNPTGSASPWLFPVVPRLPAQRYHSADKGSLGFPPALGCFVPPGSQPCV